MKIITVLIIITNVLYCQDSNTTEPLSLLEKTVNFFTTIWNVINTPLFTINNSHLSLLKILFALFILVLGAYAGSSYKRYIQKTPYAKRILSRSNRIIMANMGYYIIILVAFFISLNILGLNLSSIALIAGALSVGIGFGLQNIVSNFVSGLILMFERSIKIGDYIELTDQLRGHVTDIRMRSTTINTNSNIDVIVPNQDLIQKQVINWTMNDDIRRFDMPFSVAYGSKPEHVIKSVLDAIKEANYTDVYEDSEKITRVVMTDMGDSGVNFELFVWIKGAETLNLKRTTSRFLIIVYNALFDNGIEIPFPQRDLHLRSVDKDLLINIKERSKQNNT